MGLEKAHILTVYCEWGDLVELENDIPEGNL
jgi:hypothetical protein